MQNAAGECHPHTLFTGPRGKRTDVARPRSTTAQQGGPEGVARVAGGATIALVAQLGVTDAAPVYLLAESPPKALLAGPLDTGAIRRWGSRWTGNLMVTTTAVDYRPHLGDSASASVLPSTCSLSPRGAPQSAQLDPLA